MLQPQRLVQDCIKTRSLFTFVFLFIYKCQLSPLSSFCLLESHKEVFRHQDVHIFFQVSFQVYFNIFLFRQHDKLQKDTAFKCLNNFYGSFLNLFLCQRPFIFFSFPIFSIPDLHSQEKAKEICQKIIQVYDFLGNRYKVFKRRKFNIPELHVNKETKTSPRKTGKVGIYFEYIYHKPEDFMPKFQGHALEPLIFPQCLQITSFPLPSLFLLPSVFPSFFISFNFFFYE